jgi:hypothetical protein
LLVNLYAEKKQSLTTNRKYIWQGGWLGCLIVIDGRDFQWGNNLINTLFMELITPSDRTAS